MKKRIFLLVLFLTATPAGLAVLLYGRNPPPQEKADAPAALKAVNNKITSVTVYPGSALVTRTVEIPAGVGTFEVVVTPLPPHTLDGSLYSEGDEGVRVLTTRFRRRPVQEDTREEVRKLQATAATLAQNAQKMQSDIKVCEANLKLIDRLENSAASDNKARLESGETINLAKFVMDGRGEKAKEFVSLNQQLEQNKAQAEFVTRKIRELSAGSSREELDAVIAVEKTQEPAGAIKLNYLVDAAAWRPQYKMRAGNDAKDPIQVEYLAAIMQETGEDWSNVAMSLSTAQPMLNAVPPEMRRLSANIVSKESLTLDPATGLPRRPEGQFGQLGQIGQIGQFGQIGQIGQISGSGQMPSLSGPTNIQILNEEARLCASEGAERGEQKE